MRGKLLFRDIRKPRARIIPARAGQTHADRRQGGRTSDHPRACGANVVARLRGREDHGSSPRVRGKHVQAVPLAHQPRIIPARAGQTAKRTETRCRASDHPRACGANYPTVWEATSKNGSSPRVRGKPHGAARPLHAARIIPARAGQTGTDERRRGAPSDHPRACGANQLDARRHHRRRRIIPARAGQTQSHHGGLRPGTDHPRACGANAATCFSRSASAGSSPRVRGKRRRSTLFHDSIRIIPARAGQTHDDTRRGQEKTDHPRACGANIITKVINGNNVGSSPRVRGKRLSECLWVLALRIIPARAGQT